MPKSLSKRSLVHSALIAVLAMGCAVFGADAPDDRFHGETIPVPPRQKDPWTPPKGANPNLAEVTRLVFELGMADPRGCEYRQIKVATGTIRGGYGAYSKSKAFALQTHGWVLPAGDGKTQRFAVCWNGLVYPVLALGEPCDLEKDVADQLKPTPDNRNFQQSIYAHAISVPEGLSAGFEAPLAVNGAMLLRLGRPDLAARVWKAANTDPFSSDEQTPADKGSIYRKVAGMWLSSFYDRAVCAWMRGDDRLALSDLRSIAPVIQRARETDDRLGAKRWPEDDLFEFLARVPEYVADMERRVKEPPRPSALPLGRGRFPRKAAWIKALIDDLENVYAPQPGQPARPLLDQDATIEALAAEQNDAVEPLLDCLEHDRRFTRTVHFWRDFAPGRTMIGTHEAAYVALTKIFRIDSYEVPGNGADLTSGGPEARAKAVAAIRAYWKKRKGAPEEGSGFARPVIRPGALSPGP